MTTCYLQSALLLSTPEVAHAFCTRHGTKDGELAPAVGRHLAIDGRPVARLRQVHGRELWVATGASVTRANPPLADGILLPAPGIVGAVQTADCLPLLLYDPEIEVAAALHAGWKGTLVGIAAAALDDFQRRGSSLRRTLVALGPCIGPCCYRVPGERVEQFLASPLFRECRELAPMRRETVLDLVTLNRHLLLRAGIAPSNIEAVSCCTACRADLFHSFRRDGERAGRQWSLIGFSRRSPGASQA